MLNRKQIRFLIVCALGGFIAAVLFLFISYRSLAAVNFNQNFESKLVRTVLDGYFKAWEEADPAAMYKYLSREDQQLATLAEYQEQFAEFPVQPTGHNLKNVSFAPGIAKALIIVGWPDFSTGKSIQREELFYLVKEGTVWKVRESVSLEK